MQKEQRFGVFHKQPPVKTAPKRVPSAVTRLSREIGRRFQENSCLAGREWLWLSRRRGVPADNIPAVQAW